MTLAPGTKLGPYEILTRIGAGGMGEVEQALDWIEKGIDERDEMLITNLKTEPGYMPLRSHPRYHALLRKMNLEA